MHQGAWLVWAVSAGLVTLASTNPFYLLPILGAAWLVHASCGREGETARSFRLFVFFGLMSLVVRTALVVFGPVSLESIAAAAQEGMRLAVMLVVFGTFNSVADPFRVLRLAPRRFHEPALAAALALSIAPRTIMAVGRVREAQRLRGLETSGLRALPALAVPVLETGMEEAVTLAESMDARGHGRGRRTRYRPEPFGLRARAISVVCLGALAVYLAAVVQGTGGLFPTTFPLRWPEADPLLVGAALGFALPAFIAGDERA